MKRRATKRNNLAKSAAAGIGICLLLAIILCWGAAVGIEKELIPEERTTLCVGAGTFASALIGTAIGCKMAGEKRAAAGGIIAGGFFVILGCANALFFDGQFAGASIRILTIMGGACIAMVLNYGGKRRVRHRRIRV